MQRCEPGSLDIEQIGQVSSEAWEVSADELEGSRMRGVKIEVGISFELFDE